MQSINPDINNLHRAYCESTGFDLSLNMVTERQWLYAINHWSITPDDVRLVVKERVRGITKQERKLASIYLRNLIADDEVLAEFTQELAAIRARFRKPVHCPDKVRVLEASGRSSEIEVQTRPVGEVFEAMRRNAGA